MPVQSSAEAVTQARRLLGLSPSDEGSAWHVRRLDRERAYFLVHVAGFVACLDAGTGALMASAESMRSPVNIVPEAALECAGLGDAAHVELVWKPCAATFSMFDPLWRVESGGNDAFVDQRAKVWRTLPLGGPGGALG